jgi:ubiquitin carboxyl-terminal hydrolase 14
VLKDDFDLSSIDFAAALGKSTDLQILLMGSATKLAAPTTKTVFIEDLPPEEMAKVAEPSGLVNLGNTCYLNSVVQCLRTVPQLRRGLATYAPQNRQQQSSLMPTNVNALFLNSLRDLYTTLDRTANAVPPSNFVRATKMTFPQFAQTGPQGQPMQQDAEEFFSALLTIAASDLTNVKVGIPSVTDDELQGANNLVDAVFGLKMEEILICDECSAGGGEHDDMAMEEPAVKTFDLHRKLVCNIQGGSDGASQTNVNHIQEGIALSLNGKIEKHSDVLGRDAVWSRRQRIARLPPIIVVQFGRFYWKATPDSQDHAGVKCKVMKPVAFSSTLDVYEFCTDEVQEVLKKARAKALAEEEDRITKKLKGEEDTTIDVPDEENEEAALQAALAMSMEGTKAVGPGLPENFQGMYELFAVVTHKGRDADGGHYMGWVKADTPGKVAQKIADTDEANEDWFVFDDDEVSPCKTEDVLKLKGGGDWHMSYLNFYRAKK